MTIRDGRLHGEQVTQLATPNIYKPDEPLRSRLTVLHLTAGPIDEVHSWWMSKRSHASAHVCILENGTVRQYAGFDQRCMHAGVSWHPAYGWWANNYSVGIEFVNPCNLEARHGRYYTWRGVEYSEKGITHQRHEIDGTEWGWVPITGPQWAAGVEICELLGVPIVGHDQIASREVRRRAYGAQIWHELKPPKLDPGPAIDREAFVDEVRL